MTASKPRESILPESTRRPTWLLGVWIIPQLILLALNIRAYFLVHGDLSTDQAQRFAIFFGCEAILLVTGIALTATLAARQRLVRWLANIPILLLHLSFLVLATMWIERLIPDSATLWILPPERMIFTQFAFIMPVVFYAAVALAAFPVPCSLGKDIGLTIGTAILVPATVYFLFTFVLEFFSRSGSDLVEIVFTLILVAGTVITCMGLVRVLLLLRRWTRERGAGAQFALNLCIALLLPIGGLLVNAHIAFPYDFQAPGVYALAALNGILILLPSGSKAIPARLVWLAQAVLFPFTLYFFFVFLPFTPLSLLAMFWFLCGFFVLAPTFLFVLHGSRLVEGLRRERTAIGLGPALAMLMAAVAVVPLAYTARALFHKRQIHQALDYVYSASPAAPEAFAGSLGAVRHTLHSLQAANQGFELPFVTSYYQWLVFDNLVLPESKLQQMHLAFFGEPLETEKKQKGFMADIFPSRSRNDWRRAGRRSSPPTSAVQDRVDWRIETEGDQIRALATVTLRNPDSRLAEFVTPIQVPPGVMLSGYWLHIGAERVAGRIFEKKAAQWIYRMIRDTGPRDPGLLVYEEPGLAELRVYPLNAGEVRTTEIEFLFPAGWTPDIRVGDCPITGLTPSDNPAPIASSTAAGLVVALPTSERANIPTVQRQPILHFILDRSAATGQSLHEQLELAKHIAHRHPDAKGALVTLANFEALDLNQEPVSVDALTALADDAPPFVARGGFVRDRMIARALLQHQARCRGTTAAEWALRYPRIIVLQDPDTEPVDGTELTWFRSLCPDEPMIRVHQESETATRIALDPKAPQWTAPKPVTVVRADDNYAAAADGMVCMPGVSAEASIALFDPQQNSFVPHPEVEVAANDSRYAQGTGTWLHYYRKTWHTSEDADDLAELVAISRTTGVLTPATSYIVLENEAQWAMLERKEQQKLANQEALDLMTTPEPEIWLLLGGFVAIQWIRRRSRK